MWLIIRAAAWQNQHVRPAKTQISLSIRPVWSEFSLSVWRNLWSLATHWAHSKDWSDWTDAQADLSLRCAHRSFYWFSHAAALNCISVPPGIMGWMSLVIVALPGHFIYPFIWPQNLVRRALRFPLDLYLLGWWYVSYTQLNRNWPLFLMTKAHTASGHIIGLRPEVRSTMWALAARAMYWYLLRGERSYCWTYL